MNAPAPAELLAAVDELAASGRLLESTLTHVRAWIGSGILPAWARAALHELIAGGQVDEINNRFFRELEFGTGGMRGRTIGRTTTAAETGTPGPLGTPEHAAVGSNSLNDFTVIRATIGLYRYTEQWLAGSGVPDVPRLVVAHDVRHFSAHFAALALGTWSRLGGVAFGFGGPRSTPQLSFSVRRLRCHAGVVITASHNPPHDNGYKVYFTDGGQVVPPHDRGIVAAVGTVGLDEVAPHLEAGPGRVVTLGPADDEAYLDAAEQVVLDRAVLRRSRLKVVFTGIHGTGRIATLPLLARLGVKAVEVPEQAEPDPRFPTVKSPNPENAEALARAVELAARTRADVVLATDPDCDRMGVAVRTAAGTLQLLNGNQVGALLAEYRIRKLKELGWLPRKGTPRAALIKTFVTSRMQDAIATAHGLKVINTLTGFKWIAARIARYEEEVRRVVREQTGFALDYDATDYGARARLLLEHATFYVFGGEESYGYLPADFVRDKDGNAACALFCELAAAVKAEGLTLDLHLDALYLKYGYFTEAVGQIYYEGAEGAARIARILASYRSRPPRALGGVRVRRVRDFGRQKIVDADGVRVPAQDLFFVELADGTSYAVRGSGTEPKIKFYLFGEARAKSAKALPDTKEGLRATLEALRLAVEADAAGRAGS